MTSLSRGIRLVAALALCACLGAGSGKADEAPAEQPEALTGVTGPDQIIEVAYDGDVVEIPYILTEEGDAVFGGDIILGTAAEIFELSQQQNTLEGIADLDLFGLFQLSRRIWPKGIVSYRISAAVTYPERVRAAIAAWEKATDIRFVEAPAGTSRYVEFIRVNNSSNCSTPPGSAARKRYVKVGDGCSTGNIMHEIGHVLGLAHEHMRGDQNKFITIYTQNIKNGLEDQFKPMPRIYGDFGSYCYESLMHYGPTQWSWNGHPTIGTTKAGVEIGQRDHIAQCDIDTIQAKYSGEFAKR